MNNKKQNQKNWTKVSIRHSAAMAALHQRSGVKIKELCEMYSQYSARSISRHAKRTITEEDPYDKRKNNKGRPPILTLRDKRNILRLIPKLRRRDGCFTAAKVAVEAGVANKVHVRTVTKFMNQSGYRFLQARKKGLLSLKDLKKRLAFSRKIQRNKLGLRFWTEGISFYLDGKGFAWKRNPQDQARAPKARIWRKSGEGLNVGCTAKAGKAGVTNLNFMVAISYQRGVVLCERYHGSITGQKFAEIVYNHFPATFDKTINPRAKRILQDNCPRQNSALAKKAIYSNKVGGKIFTIPPRSPDLNPIENFFHLVTKQLEKDAKAQNITKESKEEFEERIKATMMNFNRETIDHLIESMPNRIKSVIAQRGRRLKY